ncbi:MAG: ParB/RepB/Spo0J family partition protein, partial [Acetobacteraceae bacterium]
MPELRSVDPRTLTLNPSNPRRTATPKAMDEQLIASIKAIGIIQPPVVRETGGSLAVITGNRRVQAAIAVNLPLIDVLVKNGEDRTGPMESLSENLIRASMSSVDIWRAVENLAQQSWTEQAIADALALPIRTVKRLKLLAHLHPPMLDAIARGDMPKEEQLRTIAAGTLDEQAQVWKKHKPRKNEETSWWEIARALSRRRLPFAAARFDDKLAAEYGVTWHDDLFAPADEDGRYTTDVDGFFGAQQAWLEANLPTRGTLLPHDEYGRPILPRNAERIWGKPARSDHTGSYVDPNSGEVKEIAYRLPPEKNAAKGKTTTEPAAPETATRKPRPDVTQKGAAKIGDFRTDALHR